MRGAVRAGRKRRVCWLTGARAGNHSDIRPEPPTCARKPRSTSEESSTMATKRGFMSTSTSQVSIVSTVDEHGRPLDIAVLGSPDAVRRELATCGRARARFDTPAGGRVYLQPRGTALVNDAAGLPRFTRAA